MAARVMRSALTGVSATTVEPKVCSMSIESSPSSAPSGTGWQSEALIAPSVRTHVPPTMMMAASPGAPFCMMVSPGL